MSQETDISSWFLANFESGIDTDVVRKEQLWQSYIETFSNAESGNTIRREEFFSKIGIALQDDDFKAVKTMRHHGKKIGYRFLRSKKVLCANEQKIRNIKESQLTNVEGRPVPQEIGGKQAINDLGEGSSRVHQEDPSVLERHPEQINRKASSQNFQAEKEKDHRSMGDSKLMKIETDQPSQDLGRDAENLDYVSDCDLFHEKGNEAVRPFGFCEDVVQDVSEIKTGEPSRAKLVEEQLDCSDVSNIEDREFDDSSDDAYSTFARKEDDLSDASEERSSDLEEISPRAKRSTVSKRVASRSSRSSRQKERQKRLRKSKVLKDGNLASQKKQRQDPRNLSRLSGSASSEEEVEVLRQPTNEIPVESCSFYQKHYKTINSLQPKHLPGSPKSFRDYLSRLFVAPDVANLKRIEIHRHCGESSNVPDARCRAFIAASFPPIKVGRLAGKEVDHTFNGDLFPQFSQQKKSQYQCEVCVPYQKWAIEAGFRHASLKSKGVNVENIIDGTAVLSFSGVVQTREHYQSKAHKEAIEFFQANDRKDEKKKDASKPPRKEKGIQDFFKPLN